MVDERTEPGPVRDRYAAETRAREDRAPFTITVPFGRPRLAARIARALRGHTRWW